MIGYIDIHSHILPGVDDGARDIEQTCRMLRTAYKEGIRCIIATPHFELGKKNMDPKQLREILEQVRLEASRIGEDLEIKLGNELLYSNDIIEALQHGEALTISNTRYILVEFLPGISCKELSRALNRCIYAGYIPILAHAERYECLKELNEVETIIQMGVYIQINLSSILGGLMNAKANFCKKLLQNEWVHFVGTDAHSDTNRGPYAKEAVRRMSKKYGEALVNGLVWDNPSKMLKDQHL